MVKDDNMTYVFMIEAKKTRHGIVHRETVEAQQCGAEESASDM